MTENNCYSTKQIVRCCFPEKIAYGKLAKINLSSIKFIGSAILEKEKGKKRVLDSLMLGVLT